MTHDCPLSTPSACSIRPRSTASRFNLYQCRNWRGFGASLRCVCSRDVQEFAPRRRAGAITVTLRSCTVVVLAWIALFFGTAHAQVNPSGATTPNTTAPDTIAARVLACASCHGAQGEGTSDVYFPRLAGKPAGYLYNQLVAFKNGRRRYPPMNYLLEFLPDAYLKEIAEYFASLRPPFRRPRSPPSARRFWRGVNRWSKTATLSTAFQPVQAVIIRASQEWSQLSPGLLGLRAAYISAQLGGWRYGTRTAAAPDCMQIVAGLLTEDDVKAVAAYLSSLPAPADPSFAPKEVCRCRWNAACEAALKGSCRCREP